MGAIRREEAARSQQHRDIDLVMSRNLPELLRNIVVLLLIQGIELLRIVNGDDGHSALVLDRHDRVTHDGIKKTRDRGSDLAAQESRRMTTRRG